MNNAIYIRAQFVSFNRIQRINIFKNKNILDYFMSLYAVPAALKNPEITPKTP